MLFRISLGILLLVEEVLVFCSWCPLLSTRFLNELEMKVEDLTTWEIHGGKFEAPADHEGSRGKNQSFDSSLRQPIKWLHCVFVNFLVLVMVFHVSHAYQFRSYPVLRPVPPPPQHPPIQLTTSTLSSTPQTNTFSFCPGLPCPWAASPFPVPQTQMLTSPMVQR